MASTDLRSVWRYVAELIEKDFCQRTLIRTVASKGRLLRFQHVDGSASKGRPYLRLDDRIADRVSEERPHRVRQHRSNIATSAAVRQAGSRGILRLVVQIRRGLRVVDHTAHLGQIGWSSSPSRGPCGQRIRLPATQLRVSFPISRQGFGAPPDAIGYLACGGLLVCVSVESKRGKPAVLKLLLDDISTRTALFGS